jgi:hypothetical protein
VYTCLTVGRFNHAEPCEHNGHIAIVVLYTFTTLFEVSMSYYFMM